MKFEDKEYSNGWWILLITLLVYVAGLLAGQYYGEKAFVPSQGPGSSPPFYFLRNHYIDGIFCGVTLLIIAVISGVFWKRYPHYASMGLWLGVICLGGGIIKSIQIAFNTTDILSPMAETTWATFDDYLSDPIIRTSTWVASLTGFSIALMTRPKKGSQP